MQTLLGRDRIHYTDCAVFKVSTERAGDAYLRVDRTNYDNENNAVVEVDAERFFALWRKDGSSHQDVAMGDPSSWPSDRKYDGAAEGFSHGRKNPVPLAEVSVWEKETTTPIYGEGGLFRRKAQIGEHTEKQPVLGITNGVTRTIWLLSQGAKVFPVKCDLASAALLERVAGVSGSRHATVDQLTPQAPAMRP